VHAPHGDERLEFPQNGWVGREKPMRREIAGKSMPIETPGQPPGLIIGLVHLEGIPGILQKMGHAQPGDSAAQYSNFCHIHPFCGKCFAKQFLFYGILFNGRPREKYLRFRKAFRILARRTGLRGIPPTAYPEIQF
jgi:hypothetical protein